MSTETQAAYLHGIPLWRFFNFLELDSTNSYLSVAIVLGATYLARAIIGLGSFSGRSSGMLHGDFEAQRHWLEITQHLPMKQWYFYDLPYWGLDYPPLTGYHSWLLGNVGTWINPTWFELDSSRKLEDYGLVVFMRLTVILSEYLIYVPAIFLIARRFSSSVPDKLSTITLILLQPSLLLIDHGHFQYNSVMLGFLALSVHFLMKDRYNLGAICFVLCLSFKQMGLYYAPAIFVFLLSRTIKHWTALMKVAVVTVLAFLTLFGPFYLVDGVNGLRQVLVRMFPFGRGLFEDKVANFWCASNVIYKLKQFTDNDTLQRLSLMATMTSIIPGLTMLYYRPTPRNLVLGLSNCAWGFFMFSFQVHEKSVLLPLMPATLLLFGPKEFRPWVAYINIVATFSLWPLLKKDHLELQYFVYSVFWIWLGGMWRTRSIDGTQMRVIQAVHVLTYTGIVLSHIVEPFVVVDSKPDLWVVYNVLFCVTAFSTFYLWTFVQMFRETMSV